MDALKVYPNPSSGAFFVETQEADRLHIYTLQGQHLKTHEVPAGGTWIRESLPPGLYLVQAHRTQQVQKLLVQ